MIYFKLIKIIRKLQDLGLFSISKPLAKITFALFR